MTGTSFAEPLPCVDMRVQSLIAVDDSKRAQRRMTPRCAPSSERLQDFRTSRHPKLTELAASAPLAAGSFAIISAHALRKVAWRLT